jgi:N-acetyl sugar amidotransferase
MIQYQQCSRCVMDTTDIEITFNAKGICNHCVDYAIRKDKILANTNDNSQKISEIIRIIKEEGNSTEYDCIIGISGGVDSSYVAYLAQEWGLKALLVHLDNGWNSELAVKNVENIVKHSGYDLYTLVINWEEFKDLQKAFFSADVIDLELLSDHAIFATVHKLARKYGIKYLLSGENFATEAILPKSWNWKKFDATNIKSIHRKYGKIKLKTFPFMSSFKKGIYTMFSVVQSIPILDYVEYDKNDAITVLEEKYSWRNYGGKHHESIFTRFYQGHILPEKFHIDKRKAHYSTLINSLQLSKDEALRLLSEPIYSKRKCDEDFELVCKKLNYSREELVNYLQRPGIDHSSYRNDAKLMEVILKFVKLFKR